MVDWDVCGKTTCSQGVVVWGGLKGLLVGGWRWVCLGCGAGGGVGQDLDGWLRPCARSATRDIMGWASQLGSGVH